MMRWLYTILVALAAANGAHAADPWPTRPITLIVGFVAGGNTDMAARILANSMKQQVPVPVVVENRPGAGGTLGASYVVRAPADGTTILVASQSETTMLRANRARPPYDLDDLIPVGRLMDQDYALVVPTSLGVNSWAEFVAYAKRRGSVTYATSGVGTTAHVMSEHLARAIGVEAVHVPYQGAAGFRSDLVAGRVDFAIDVIPLSMPFIADGRVRAIAVTQAATDARLPDAPSLVQLGVFPEAYAGWTGVFVPRGTPIEIRAALQRIINQMLQSAGGEEIERNGYRRPGTPQGPDDFSQFTARDQARWVATFRAVGIPPSQ